MKRKTPPLHLLNQLLRRGSNLPPRRDIHREIRRPLEIPIPKRLSPLPLDITPQRQHTPLINPQKHHHHLLHARVVLAHHLLLGARERVRARQGGDVGVVREGEVCRVGGLD
jgi:hypothetical protein